MVEILNHIVGKHTWKRKIAKSLLIKEQRLTLNIHNKSVPLKLFN